MLATVGRPARDRGARSSSWSACSRAASSSVGYDELTVVLEGAPGKLDDFTELLGNYGVVALQRTGRVALPRIERRRPELSAVPDAS